MADITPVAGDVRSESTNPTFRSVQYGEAVSQGDWIYKSSSDNKHYKADNTTAEKSDVVGVAMLKVSTVDNYGPIAYVADDEVNFGATLVKGETYVLSDTAGMAMPVGDLTSGDYVTYLYFGKDTDTGTLMIKSSGVAK